MMNRCLVEVGIEMKEIKIEIDEERIDMLMMMMMVMNICPIEAGTERNEIDEEMIDMMMMNICLIEMKESKPIRKNGRPGTLWG